MRTPSWQYQAMMRVLPKDIERFVTRHVGDTHVAIAMALQVVRAKFGTTSSNGFRTRAIMIKALAGALKH